MATEKRIPKEQIIIDLKYKEIKGTNTRILKQIKEVLENDLSFTEYFKLDNFNIVKSLTDDKERAPKNFKPITYKTRKIDILAYLEKIKDSDRDTYEEYKELIDIEEFVILNKRFNEELIQTEEQKTLLQEIIEKNNVLLEKEKQEKARIQAEKEARRQQRKKEKELQNS